MTQVQAGISIDQLQAAHVQAQETGPQSSGTFREGRN